MPDDRHAVGLTSPLAGTVDAIVVSVPKPPMNEAGRAGAAMAPAARVTLSATEPVTAKVTRLIIRIVPSCSFPVPRDLDPSVPIQEY